LSKEFLNIDLSQKEQVEIDFWKNSPKENPEVFSRGNFLNKTREARQFNYKINRHKKVFRKKKNILELGAGQGWASCYLKKFLLPNSHFTVTDISIYAIESLPYWEKVYDVKIDNKLACKSYEVPLRDGSFDLIFCYAAAHHFVKLDETIKECQRLLMPGGQMIFLYEPTCSRLFYPLHFKYVNTAAHNTPEDVLIPGEIKKLAKKHELKFVNHYDAHQTLIRSIPIHLYFRFLKALPFLQKTLPSSSDMVFTKAN
jgi:ubiquinone/menaquinone biosynthesis C-methylase UbiE